MQEGFKKSDIEILVSTMNRNSLDFLIPMFPFVHYSDYKILVINQTTEGNIAESSYSSVRVINFFEKGLSKSRNMALDNAVGKLCVITDDDVVFDVKFNENIITAFNENKDATLIAFRIMLPGGGLFRKYPLNRKTNLSVLDRMNIISIEMVLNRELIGNTKFNESFGLGAKFGMGEEALFVNKLYKHGCKIILEPGITTQHSAISTNSKVTVKEKYYILGAFYTALFGENYFKWLLLKLLFDLKQKKIGLTKLKTALHFAAKGKRDYMSTNENNN